MTKPITDTYDPLYRLTRADTNDGTYYLEFNRLAAVSGQLMAVSYQMVSENEASSNSPKVC